MRLLLRKTGGPFSQTEGRDENQELEGNSQTNNQVVMPTDDVPTDDVVVISDISTEEEQLSNSQSHCT